MVRRNTLSEIMKEFYRGDLFKQLKENISQIKQILTHYNWVEKQKDSKNLKKIGADLVKLNTLISQTNRVTESLLRIFSYYYSPVILQTAEPTAHTATAERAIIDPYLREELHNIGISEAKKIVNELNRLKRNTKECINIFFDYRSYLSSEKVPTSGPYKDKFYEGICKYIEEHKKELIEGFSIPTISQKNLIKGMSKKFHKGVERIGGDLGKQLDILINNLIQRLRKTLGNYFDRNSELLLRRILWNEKLNILRNRASYASPTEAFSKILEDEYSIIESKGKGAPAFIRSRYRKIERELKDLEELYKKENRDILSFIRRLSYIKKEDLIDIADIILYSPEVRSLLRDKNFRELLYTIIYFYLKFKELYHKEYLEEQKRQMTAEEEKKFKGIFMALKLKQMPYREWLYPGDLGSLFSALAQLSHEDISKLNQIDVRSFKRLLHKYLRTNRQFYRTSESLSASIILTFIALAFFDTHFKNTNYLIKQGFDFIDIIIAGGVGGLFALIVLDKEDFEFLLDKIAPKEDVSLFLSRLSPEAIGLLRRTDFRFLKKFFDIFAKEGIELKPPWYRWDFEKICLAIQTLPKDINIRKLAEIFKSSYRKEVAFVLRISKLILEQTKNLDLLVELCKGIPECNEEEFENIINAMIKLSSLHRAKEIMDNIDKEGLRHREFPQFLTFMVENYPEEIVYTFTKYFSTEYFDIEVAKRVLEQLKQKNFVGTLYAIFE